MQLDELIYTVPLVMYDMLRDLLIKITFYDMLRDHILIKIIFYDMLRDHILIKIIFYDMLRDHILYLDHILCPTPPHFTRTYVTYYRRTNKGRVFLRVFHSAFVRKSKHLADESQHHST